jgi:hypothetical protein
MNVAILSVRRVRSSDVLQEGVTRGHGRRVAMAGDSGFAQDLRHVPRNSARTEEQALGTIRGAQVLAQQDQDLPLMGMRPTSCAVTR